MASWSRVKLDNTQATCASARHGSSSTGYSSIIDAGVAKRWRGHGMCCCWAMIGQAVLGPALLGHIGKKNKGTTVRAVSNQDRGKLADRARDQVDNDEDAR